MDVQPGETVVFQIRMTGIVAGIRNGGKVVRIRTKNNEWEVPPEFVVEILDPKPPEDQVVAEQDCPRCGSKRRQQCADVRFNEPMPGLKHPHRQRTVAWVERTGWKP